MNLTSLVSEFVIKSSFTQEKEPLALAQALSILFTISFSLLLESTFIIYFNRYGHVRVLVSF